LTHSTPAEIYTPSHTTLFRSPTGLRDERDPSLAHDPPTPESPDHGRQRAGRRRCADHRADDDQHAHVRREGDDRPDLPLRGRRGDRKSTRLNSSHVKISYAVF